MDKTGAMGLMQNCYNKTPREHYGLTVIILTENLIIPVPIQKRDFGGRYENLFTASDELFSPKPVWLNQQKNH